MKAYASCCIRISKSSSCNEGEEQEEQEEQEGQMRDSAKIKDMLRMSGFHPESGGRIRFYPSMAKNDQCCIFGRYFVFERNIKIQRREEVDGCNGREI